MLASNSQTIAFSPEHSDARQALTLPVSEIDEDRADTGRAGDFLVASPYTSQPHLLNLQALNTSQQLLAKALVAFQPLRDDYATASYAKAFNWDVVINELRISSDQRGFIWKGQHFYIVVFRSQVPQSTNRVELGELDRRSHAEATKSGGLLKYWFGIPDENGRNLATCIWRRSEDAKPASTGPGHKAAMRATISMYSEWKIERLKLNISDCANAWTIQQWED